MIYIVYHGSYVARFLHPTDERKVIYTQSGIYVLPRKMRNDNIHNEESRGAPCVGVVAISDVGWLFDISLIGGGLFVKSTSI